MATRAQLEQYAKNSNVRKFLDLISYTEGTQGNGYRTAFGGGRLSSLNDHPRYSKSFKQLNGKTNTTSAAGRYQFLKSTWDGVARQYGLRDFSPHSQDLGAIALLIGRGALAPLLKGDWQTAVRKSGKEWASLPTAPASYSQPTKSWAKVNQFMTGKASNTPSGYQEPSQPQKPLFQAPSFRPSSDLQGNNKPLFAVPDWQPASKLEQGFKPPDWSAPSDNTPDLAAQVPLFQAPEWQSGEPTTQTPLFESQAFEPESALISEQTINMQPPDIGEQGWQT